jgi:cytochrome c biogenesis protein CcmG, thiol:disulfide interchange protein DsbE
MSSPLLALALLAGLSDPVPPGVGDPAPPLEIVTPDGSAARARLEGEVFVVDFFATWCGPCHRALRDLVAVREQLGPRVHFVFVDVEEPPETVREFLAHNPLPGGAQVTVDPRGVVMQRWGARTFPTTFLVDRAGVVRHINRGWGDGYRARLLAWLRPMLAAPAADRGASR